MDQKIVFCEGSEGKEALLDYKNIDLKNHQNLHLFKGIKRKRFLEGSEGKEVFLDHKKITLKNHQNLRFLKWLVHGFCQKMDIF